MAQKILEREIIFCGPDLRFEVRKISLLAWKKMETAMNMPVRGVPAPEGCTALAMTLIVHHGTLRLETPGMLFRMSMEA